MDATEYSLGVVLPEICLLGQVKVYDEQAYQRSPAVDLRS